MKATLKNELWEALVKTAVIQYSNEENSSIPTEEELKILELPENYERRLNNFIKHYSKRKNWKSLLYYSRKIASIILIIIGITFTGLLQFEEIRAACLNVFIEIHDKYMQIDFIPSASESESTSRLRNLPDGFHLAEFTADEYQNYWRYENYSNDIIELYIFKQEYTIYLDNEHYNVSDIQINHYNGKFFESNNSNFMNYVTWNTDTEYFSLSSSMDKNFLIKLAENIK